MRFIFDSTMTQSHLTARQQQAQARRAKILETAVQLFAQNGFHGTSTRQIAAAAGITEGLIFHYFPTKNHLLEAILASDHSYFNDLRAILANAAQDEPVEAVLSQIAYGWLATLRREQAITLVLFGEAQTNPQVREALQTLIKIGISQLAAYLQTQVAKGQLRKDLPLATSSHMFFSSLMIFFVSRHTLSQSAWADEVAAFVPQMISVWVKGAR